MGTGTTTIRDENGKIVTRGWHTRPRRPSNNTTINDAATIDSIKRMALNVHREMERLELALLGAGLEGGITLQIKNVAEFVANLNQRIQNEVV